MSASIEIALVVITGAAAWSDFRTRHIPNWITVPGASIGLLLHAFHGGIPGALTSLAGAALGMGIFIGLFIAGGMGAGDVKLFGTVGALVGPEALVLVFVFTGLLGGVAAIGLSLARGRLRETVDRTGQLVAGIRSGVSADSLRLPYGVVIAGGVLLWMIVRTLA
jgi:prepilin peptidase CpaA